ncbi:hypothetical protein AX769_15350 [Frondihabitans sp. PAMC 28766]|nr:hypothetical protein AX769_15350 [Frondihabitans sp. PAMC 28766]
MLRGVGRSPDDDVFASAVWSCLVEPGDGVGGLLRRTFGPAGALASLASGDDEVKASMAAVGEDADRVDLAAARRRWAPRSTLTVVRTAFRFASVLGIRLVVPGDTVWPGALDSLGDHGPAALWVRGRPETLAVGPSVALVGSRAASAYGEQVAAELANGLVGLGVGVHSGGAYGVDGMAHRATLAASGATIAIMAGGVDKYYPPGNHDLLQRVADEGAVIAEVACGTSPSRWRFLQRNRLIAALTAGTVVVEAGHRSGALNTASHARSLDRPIGAVPGPITSPASAGCHRLMRDPDVACVTSAADILEMIRPSLVAADVRLGPQRDSPDEMRLLDALSQRRARSEAELAARAGLDEAVVRATLAVLELDGRAAERDSGWVRCASPRPGEPRG